MFTHQNINHRKTAILSITQEFETLKQKFASFCNTNELNNDNRQPSEFSNANQHEAYSISQPSSHTKLKFIHSESNLLSQKTQPTEPLESFKKTTHQHYSNYTQRTGSNPQYYSLKFRNQSQQELFSKAKENIPKNANKNQIGSYVSQFYPDEKKIPDSRSYKSKTIVGQFPQIKKDISDKKGHRISSETDQIKSLTSEADCMFALTLKNRVSFYQNKINLLEKKLEEKQGRIQQLQKDYQRLIKQKSQLISQNILQRQRIGDLNNTIQSLKNQITNKKSINKNQITNTESNCTQYNQILRNLQQNNQIYRFLNGISNQINKIKQNIQSKSIQKQNYHKVTGKLNEIISNIKHNLDQFHSIIKNQIYHFDQVIAANSRTFINQSQSDYHQGFISKQQSLPKITERQ